MEKKSIRLYNKNAIGFLEFSTDITPVYSLLKGDLESCHDAIWRAVLIVRNVHGLVVSERDLTLQEKSIEGLTSLISVVEYNNHGAKGE